MSNLLNKLYNNELEKYEAPKLTRLIFNCEHITKEKFRVICIKNGISMSDAINRFMEQVIEESEAKK